MKPVNLESATLGNQTIVSGCRLKSAADLKIIETCERIQAQIIELHEALHNYMPAKPKVKMYNDNHLFI